jgi:hypothetical protein
MTKPQIARDPAFGDNSELTACEALTRGVVILGTDFRSKRRERVYDADKVWSGDHTIRDYTEI